jgi:hypothetical protein
VTGKICFSWINFLGSEWGDIGDPHQVEGESCHGVKLSGNLPRNTITDFSQKYQFRKKTEED